MEYCPVCGSKMINATVAVRYSVCPRCGYNTTEFAGRVEAPSLLEGFIMFIGILGLTALLTAGLSLLLKSVLEGAQGDSNVSRIREATRASKRACNIYR